MRRTTLLWTCSVLGALSGCGSDSGSDNKNPVISDLSVDREAVLSGTGTAAVTVLASDPDGDPLQYSWSVTVGTLDAAAGPGPVNFIAPAERGLATVTVTVTDGQGGTATQSVDVGVLGWVVPASAATVTPGRPFSAVSFSSAEDGVISGGSETDNVPYIYHFKAGTWADETKGTSGHLPGAKAFAPNDIWTVGGGGLLFHYDGAAWTQGVIPGGCTHSLDGISPTDIWVSCGEGQPYVRHYTGGGITDWTQLDAPAGLNGGVSMVAANDGWVVGTAGGVARYNGTAWQAVDVPVTSTLTYVDMVDANDGWIVGNSGKILHWDGSAWTEVVSNVGGTLYGVSAVAADDVWAVGVAGAILHWDGTAWALVPSPTTEILTAVTMLSATDGWIVGANSTILHLE